MSFFELFLISVSSSLIFYVFGHLTFSIFIDISESEPTRFFKKLVWGLIFLISLFALFKSGFNTILIGVPILCGISYFLFNDTKFEKKNFFFLNIRKIEWVQFGYFIPALFLLNLFFYFRGHTLSGQLISTFWDNVYYGGISDYLNQYGIETQSINNFDLEYTHASFYHFFNEWVSAFISNLYNITGLTAYLFVSIPLMFSIVFMGAFAISYKIFNRNPFYHFLIACSIFFISGFGELIIRLLTGKSVLTFWDMNPLHLVSSKLAVCFILGLYSALNYSKKLGINFYLPLLLLSIIYPITLPSIISAILFVLIYEYWSFKRVQKKIFLLTFLTLLFVVIFFILNSFITKYPFSDEAFTLKNHFDLYISSNVFKLKHLIIPVYVGILRFFLANLFFIFLIIINKSLLKIILGSEKSIFIFLFGLILSGVFLNLLFVFHPDGYQFMFNSAYPVYIILLFVILCLILYQSRKLEIFALGVFMFAWSYTMVKDFPGSHDLKLKVADDLLYKELMSEFGSSKFSSVYLNPENIYSHPHHLMIIPYGDIRRFNSNYFPVPLSIFDSIPYVDINDISTHKTHMFNTPFYNFVKLKKMEKNLEKAKIDFILGNKINYIFAHRENRWFKRNKGNFKIEKVIEIKNYDYIIAKLNHSYTQDKNNTKWLTRN